MIILIITIRMSSSSTVSEWSFLQNTHAIRFGDKMIDIVYFNAIPDIPWFKGKPVAEALEYVDTRKAISTHVPERIRFCLKSDLKKK